MNKIRQKLQFTLSKIIDKVKKAVAKLDNDIDKKF